MPATPDNSSILALDVGSKRIGVAIASLAARLPRPYDTLANDASFGQRLQQIIGEETVSLLIVGLPRGLNGQDTDQTRSIQAFTTALQEQLSIPVRSQDEAVTSAQAEAELKARGKIYQKGDIDALAATYILEDYLRQQGGDV